MVLFAVIAVYVLSDHYLKKQQQQRSIPFAISQSVPDSFSKK